MFPKLVRIKELFGSRRRLRTVVAMEEPPGPSAPLAPSLIREVNGPLRDDALRALKAIIDADADRVQRNYQRNSKRVLGEAVSLLEELAERGRRSAQRAAEALSKLASTQSKANLFQAVLFLTGGACCYLGELALTLAILPDVLGLRPDHPLGVSTAVAATCAILVLEILFTRLLERPFRERGRMGPVAQRVLWAFMGGFLLALGAAVGTMIYALAQSREALAKLSRDVGIVELLEGQSSQLPVELSSVELQQIGDAIVLLSVIVAVTSAYLFSFGFGELGAWIEGRRARRQARAAERKARDDRSMEGYVRGKVAEFRDDVESEHGAQRAEHYRREQLFRLEARQRPIHQPSPPSPASEPQVPVETLPTEIAVRSLERRHGLKVVRDRPA